jgi:phage-related protein
MSYSFSFNGTDLSAYGLIVSSAQTADSAQESESQLIQDRSYGFRPKRPPKSLKLDVSVVASDRIHLDSRLDTIKRIIITSTAYVLRIHSLPMRYWLAKAESMTGRFVAPNCWSGSITFVADDPAAYDISEASNDYNIDADPKTVSMAVGGTAYAIPIYTLTAGEVLTDVTIKVENVMTSEELQWTGSLGNGEVLVIDVGNWLVTKEGTASMATVTGQFPRLVPSAVNQIIVTGFSNTGTLNITYRNRFL